MAAAAELASFFRPEMGNLGAALVVDLAAQTLAPVEPRAVPTTRKVTGKGSSLLALARLAEQNGGSPDPAAQIKSGPTAGSKLGETILAGSVAS